MHNIFMDNEYVFGYLNTLILLDNGKVLSCGYNKYGQLGLNHNKNTNKFQEINIKNIKQIACGYSFSLILTEDNKLYGFG